jgi:hypothetical protein
MKKINSIRQLQLQKQLLKLQQLTLEKEIANQWKGVKTSLTPANIARDTLNNIIKTKTEEKLNDGSALKNAVTYGITLIASQLVNKAGEKLNKVFKK